MSAEHPIVGLTASVERARWGAWSEESSLVPHAYVRAVSAAGGTPLVLPPDPAVTADPDRILDLLDALVLTGGSDVDPSRYGEAPHPETAGTYPERDDFELALVRRALERDLPFLGICRGMQVLNVARGGTLIQHLPDEVRHEDHRRTLGSFDNADHDVRLESGSLAARAAGALLHGTKSHHHQGIRRIGEDLVVTGRATVDDLPEAIEDPSRRFALGVQWHPEADPDSRVIAALVASVRPAGAAGRAEAAAR